MKRMMKMMKVRDDDGDGREEGPDHAEFVS